MLALYVTPKITDLLSKRGAVFFLCLSEESAGPISVTAPLRWSSRFALANPDEMLWRNYKRQL